MWKPKFLSKQPPQDENPGSSVMIVAQINARLQPVERGEYFEDPLDTVLKELKLGEVTGGGTQLADEPDGIAHCDVEIVVGEASESTLARIIAELERLGAPKGSLLKRPDATDDIAFGKLEGLAVFLNGTGLPDEVYANADVNEVISRGNRLLRGIGEFRGHWEGSSETALYFYGTSYEAMRTALSDLIANEPLCRLSRVQQIA